MINFKKQLTAAGLLAVFTATNLMGTIGAAEIRASELPTVSSQPTAVEEETVTDSGSELPMKELVKLDFNLSRPVNNLGNLKDGLEALTIFLKNKGLFTEGETYFEPVIDEDLKELVEMEGTEVKKAYVGSFVFNFRLVSATNPNPNKVYQAVFSLTLPELSDKKEVTLTGNEEKDNKVIKEAIIEVLQPYLPEGTEIVVVNKEKFNIMNDFNSGFEDYRTYSLLKFTDEKADKEKDKWSKVEQPRDKEVRDKEPRAEQPKSNYSYSSTSTWVSSEDKNHTTKVNQSEKITRLEVAEYLQEQLKLYATKSTPNGKIYKDDDQVLLKVMRENKLFVGDTNSNFRPNDYLTRAELAVLIDRLLPENHPVTLKEFLVPDVKEGHWAFHSVQVVLNSKLMNTKGEEFQPNSNPNKKEVLDTLNKVIKMK